MKIGEQTIVFLAVNKNGDEVILNNAPARQGEIWTDERSAHDEEYFSVEDHNSASFSIKYLLAIFPLSLFSTMHSSLAISINSR